MKIKYNGEVIAKIELDEGETLTVGKEDGSKSEMIVCNNLNNLQAFSDVDWKQMKAEQALSQVDGAFEYFKKCCEAFEQALGKRGENPGRTLQINLFRQADFKNIVCQIRLEKYDYQKTGPKGITTTHLCEGPEIILPNNDVVTRYFIALIIRFALKKGYFKTDDFYENAEPQNTLKIFDDKFLERLGRRRAERKVLVYESSSGMLSELFDLLSRAIKGGYDESIITGIREGAIHTMSFDGYANKDLTMDSCAKKVQELIPKLALLLNASTQK